MVNENLHYRFLYCYQTNCIWQEQNHIETFLKLRLQAYTSLVLIISDVAVVCRAREYSILLSTTKKVNKKRSILSVLMRGIYLILVWLSKCRRFQIVEARNILPGIDTTKQTNKFQNFDLLDPSKLKEELRIPKRILEAISNALQKLFWYTLQLFKFSGKRSDRFGIYRLIRGTSLETHVCSVSTSSSPRYIAYLPLKFMRAETLFLWTQRCTSERHSVRVVPTYSSRLLLDCFQYNTVLACPLTWK